MLPACIHAAILPLLRALSHAISKPKQAENQNQSEGIIWLQRASPVAPWFSKTPVIMVPLGNLARFKPNHVSRAISQDSASINHLHSHIFAIKPWSRSGLWHPGPTISLLCQRPSNSVPGIGAAKTGILDMVFKEYLQSDKDLAVSAGKRVPPKLAEIWQCTTLGTLHHLANGRFRALQARCRGTVPATI